MTRPFLYIPALRRASVALALVCAASNALSAQEQTFTLKDIFARLRTGEQQVDFARAHPTIDARITLLDAYFSAAHAMDLTIDQLTDVYTDRRADIGIVARWDRDRFAGGAVPGLADSLVALNTIAHGTLQSDLAAKLSKDALDALYKPIDDFGTRVLEKARDKNQEKLRRFAVKYGPDSPHLNLAEVGLNYAAQLFLPGFLPDEEGSPTPFELVATYRTTDLTAAQSAAGNLTARVVTSAQLGLRWYSFNEGCGKGSRFSELLNPCQSSIGGFVMGPADTPLGRTWGSGSRAGAYLARGKYHVGYVFGGNQRVVFGVDQQVLPYVF